eukprot:6196537-Pleurochrysis_carterae.AAC.2
MSQSDYGWHERTRYVLAHRLEHKLRLTSGCAHSCGMRACKSLRFCEIGSVGFQGMRMFNVLLECLRLPLSFQLEKG